MTETQTTERKPSEQEQDWECSRCGAAINLESSELACACGCYWITPRKASAP